jgi:uncharacterized membrane protein
MEMTDAERRSIVAAIKRAEAGNPGEVRVHVETHCRSTPLVRARELFEELGLGKTRDGTGVLLYVASADRVTSVFAGPGIHTEAGPGFWKTVTDEVAAGFRAGKGASGIVRAVDRIGDLLREKHPRGDRHGNELPDTVSSS